MKKSIRRNIAGFLFLSFLMVSASGCAIPLLVYAVGAGVVGGYVVSPDTVEGQASRSLEECWDAAKEITGIMGKIEQDAASGNQLVATISGTRVTVTLTAINVSTTKITVKARKAFMPKIDVAQDVYTKIINGMEK